MSSFESDSVYFWCIYHKCTIIILKFDDYDEKDFTEINKNALEDNNSDFREMLDLLENYNFEFYISDDNEGNMKKVKNNEFEKLLKDNLVLNVLCKKNMFHKN